MQDCELRLQRRPAKGAGDEPFWAQLTGLQQTTADGEPACWVTFSDISERRRAEEAARAGEARFRGYFEQSLIGVAVTSPEKGWVDVNQAVCDLLGYSREELAGLTWAELTHPDDLAADEAQFERVLAGEIDGYRLEKRFVRKDGGVVDVDLGVRCSRAADGTVDHILALLSDVTERHRDAALLAASEERFRLLAENAADVVFLSVGGILEWISPSVVELLGWRPQDLVGVETTGLWHPDDRAAVVALREAAHRGAQGRGEWRIRAKDGRHVWVDVAVRPFADERGRNGMVGSMRDVTTRREALVALADSEARWRAIAEGASEGINVLDLRSGRYTFMSPAQVAMTGFTADEMNDLATEEAHERLHPDDRAISIEQQRRLAAGEGDVRGGRVPLAREERRVPLVPRQPSAPARLRGAALRPRGRQHRHHGAEAPGGGPPRQRADAHRVGERRARGQLQLGHRQRPCLVVARDVPPLRPPARGVQRGVSPRWSRRASTPRTERWSRRPRRKSPRPACRCPSSSAWSGATVRSTC